MIWFSSGVGRDMDQPERMRADRDARDQKNRNVGNPEPQL